MKAKKKVVERPEATERVLKERRQSCPPPNCASTTEGFRKMSCPNKFAFGANGEHERARDLVPPQTQRVLGAHSKIELITVMSLLFIDSIGNSAKKLSVFEPGNRPDLNAVSRRTK